LVSGSAKGDVKINRLIATRLKAIQDLFQGKIAGSAVTFLMVLSMLFIAMMAAVICPKQSE